MREGPDRTDDTGFDDAEATDAELLAAHVAGDRLAFEQLFLRHRRPLYFHARSISRTPEDAADALQEAMLKAHRNAPSFRYDCTVNSWLHRIVANACVDRLRRAAARPTVALADHVVAVGDSSRHTDTAIVVRAALMSLSVDQRAAVVAVDLLGYSIADAATLLGVAHGTVKSRCSRGRARLAVSLGYLRGTDTDTDTETAATRAG